MSEIVVEGVRAEEGRVRYDYDLSSDLRRFFAEEFAVSYDVDVSAVPESVLVIPLLANLCPVAWAAGADVYVPRADETFLKSLADVRGGFETLYPEMIRESTVYAKEVVTNEGARGKSEEYRVENEGDRGGTAENGGAGRDGKSAALFSGGVDSLTTYFRHREEDPTLVSVRGFDIVDDDRWNERERELRAFGASRGLENRFVRMNMQGFLDLVMLNAHFGGHYDDNWITSVHHGLGLVGACAPLSVTEGFDTLYIAATHSEDFSHPWGSHPEIDDRVAWATTAVEHDGYELTRQEKLFELAEHVREADDDLEIRTCSAAASGNCGRCEKCMRTAVGLLLAGLDPADHGYDFDARTFEYVRAQFEAGNWHLGADERFMWRDIQNHAALDREYPYPGAESFFAWLRGVDVDALSARASAPESTDSVRNRAVYAIARHTPYPIYSRLYAAYSSLGERRSG